MRIARAVFASTAIVGLLAGCGDDTGTSDTTGVPVTSTPAVADPLDGTSWVLDVAGLGIAGAGDVVATINFAAGRASGNGGCNQFSGPYTVEGAGLVFGEVAQTAMACPGVRMDVEAAVTGAFGKVTSFVVAGESLALADAAGATLLTYTAAPTDVTGVWSVTGFSNGTGLASVIAATALTATFADGAVSGSSGCNTYRGGYTLTDRVLSFTAFSTTKIGCPDDVMEQEAAFLAALGSATSFTNDGTHLVLIDGAGQVVVSLVAA